MLIEKPRNCLFTLYNGSSDFMDFGTLLVGFVLNFFVVLQAFSFVVNMCDFSQDKCKIRTIVSSVACRLTGSKAGDNLVFMQTSLLLLCKSSFSCANQLA